MRYPAKTDEPRLAVNPGNGVARRLTGLARRRSRPPFNPGAGPRPANISGERLPCLSRLVPITMGVADIHARRLSMAQITTRLPEDVVRSLDLAARTLHRSRADIVRHAIERYLEDFADLDLAVERLKDPADPVLDWETVKGDLLAQD